MSSENRTEPFGLCQCGCGERTTVHKGVVRDYIRGHSRRIPVTDAQRAAHRDEWERRGIPYGLCLCGCGQATEIASGTNNAERWLAGEPKRYVQYHIHQARRQGYREEDRGYETPCWVWQGVLNEDGYGHINGRGVHRVAYEKVNGPIPAHLEIDHLCKVRNCVNPDHLEAVPHKINTWRASNKKLSYEIAQAVRDEFCVFPGSKTAFCRMKAPVLGVCHQTVYKIVSGDSWVLPTRDW